LGVAAWCWRNNTAVEDWHLPSEVLMARVNFTVTKAIQPHLDPFEGRRLGRSPRRADRPVAVLFVLLRPHWTATPMKQRGDIRYADLAVGHHPTRTPVRACPGSTRFAASPRTDRDRTSVGTHTRGLIGLRR
jgi:hypothetical protein